MRSIKHTGIRCELLAMHACRPLGYIVMPNKVYACSMKGNNKETVKLVTTRVVQEGCVRVYSSNSKGKK